MEHVLDRLRSQHDPDIRVHILRVNVVAGLCAARCLQVDELLAAVHPPHHIQDDCAQLLLFVRDTDIQHGGAPVESVEVFVQCKGDMVACVGHVVHAVPEEVDAVIEGDCHLLHCAESAVVVPEIFHLLPCSFPVRNGVYFHDIIRRRRRKVKAFWRIFLPAGAVFFCGGGNPPLHPCG